MTEDEVKRLIDACPKYLKPIVITAVYTGLRKSDILNLKWRDIDLEKGLIRLEEAKTGKTRNIVLNSDMITLLQSLPVKCQYVFPNKHGKPFKDIKRSFESGFEKSGIEQSDDRRHKIVFHTLRHTCVSSVDRKGSRYDRRQELCGPCFGGNDEALHTPFRGIRKEDRQRFSMDYAGLSRFMETIWKQWLKMKKWLKIPLLQVPEFL